MSEEIFRIASTEAYVLMATGEMPPRQTCRICGKEAVEYKMALSDDLSLSGDVSEPGCLDHPPNRNLSKHPSVPDHPGEILVVREGSELYPDLS